MEAWLRRAQESGVVVRVPATQVQHGVYCVAHENTWYHDGVAFDWSALHARLGDDGDGSMHHSTHALQSLLVPHLDALRAFGAARLREKGASRCLVTVVEVVAPWEVQPLSSQAQQMSVFTTRSADGSEGSSSRSSGNNHGRSDAVADLTFYRFQRGPPGVRGVVRDIATALRGVASQLQSTPSSSSSSLCVLYCFSSFVICSDDFTALLHHTAAVHKALKGCGLVLDMHRSCLVPQRIWAVDDASTANAAGDGAAWCVLPPHALTDEADVLRYVADLFFQWLHDCCYWGCGAPVRVYATLPAVRPAMQHTGATPGRDGGATDDGSSGSKTGNGSDRSNKGDNNGNDNDNDETDVAMKRARAFVHFVRVVVLPRAERAGLSTLRMHVPTSDNNAWQRLAPLSQRVRVLHGPQKWTSLDLRLTLCRLDAYTHDPHTLLRDVPHQDAQR